MIVKKIMPALALLVTAFGYSQKYNCDVREAQLGVYEFALQNLDSIKKHTSVPSLTLYTELPKGGAKKLTWYKAYGTKDQKEIKPWGKLDDQARVLFSLCPDSYFYGEGEQILKGGFTLTLDEGILKEKIAEKTSAPGRIVPGTLYENVAENASYTLDLKQLTISGSGMGGKHLSGTMKGYSSGILELSPEFHIVFKLDTTSDPKTVYLSYKFIETINYKAVVITEEKRRPLVNGGAYVKVSGVRENDGIPAQENKNFSAEFSIRFE